MRKILVVLLMIMIFASLAACKKEENIITKLLADGYESHGCCYSEDGFVGLFQKENEDYKMVKAPISKSLSAKLEALDICDENYDTDFNKLIGKLENCEVVELTAYAPDSNYLSSLAGKTLQQLVDEGFYGSDYCLGETSASTTMTKNLDDVPCGYEIYMELDYIPAPTDFENFELENHLDIKVTSATFNGFTINVW